MRWDNFVILLSSWSEMDLFLVGVLVLVTTKSKGADSSGCGHILDWALHFWSSSQL